MTKPNINVAVGAATVTYPREYKTVVLKPNIPFAEQVTDEDTKYTIKYNFDLGGEEVTIPEGCVLEFDGGSLSNGTLKNTYVTAERYMIFDDIAFVNLKTYEVYPEWFGAVADGTIDCSKAFDNACGLGKTVKLSGGTYLVEDAISCSSATSIVGENRKRSILKTNGITLNTNSQVNSLTVEAVSKTTPYLLKIPTSNFGTDEYYAKINIDDVEFVGAPFNVYDTSVTGLLLECKTEANKPQGFYGVNVSNTFFRDRLQYGILFDAKSADAWITFCNFTNVFINNAIYPIEFSTVNTGSSFYNFQNIYFKNVTAQYNVNTSVTPNTPFTLSFVRMAHCSRVIFDGCCCVDSPTDLKTYYFKDVYNGIAINNEGEDSISRILGRYDNAEWQKILSQNVYGIVTTFNTRQILIPTESTSWKSSALETVPDRSLISPLYNDTNHFVGFKLTNNSSISSSRKEFLLGMIDGHVVHTELTSPDTDFSVGHVYSTKYVPKFGSGDTFPSGYGRGSFMYHTGLGHILCYDSYTNQWKDAFGIRITNDISKRVGTTTDREGVTVPSYIDGFLFYDTTLHKYVNWTGSKWIEYDGATAGVERSGASSGRPTGSKIYVGFMFFDTTLGKPIYASAISGSTVTWVDATGTEV